jgi:alpha-glucosidase
VFQEALTAAAGSDARERYIFRDGRGENGDEPPNSWHSVFGGPAWERVTEPDGRPGQWYLHLFDVTQPDLNWSNPEVRAEFVAVLKFWLDRGVDGFRVGTWRTASVKEENLSEWQGAGVILGGADPAGPPPPMWDQEGVHEIYRQWRAVLTSTRVAGILVAEAWVQPAERLARYVRPDEMHQAFNFEYLDAPWSPIRCAGSSTHHGANVTVGAPTTWVLSNHDVVRHAPGWATRSASPAGTASASTTRSPDVALGLRRARAATLQMLALPGSGVPLPGRGAGAAGVTPRSRTRTGRTRPGCGPGTPSGAGTAAGCRSRGRRRAVVRLRALGRELAAAARGLGRVRAGPAARRGRLDVRAVPARAAAAAPTRPRRGTLTWVDTRRTCWRSATASCWC